MTHLRRGWIKTLVFTLTPALAFFLSLELIQRVRCYRMYDDPKWLYYGLTTTSTGPTEIPIGRRFADVELRRTHDFPGPRIVCIGGSTTYGAFNDRQHTYPRLLDYVINAVVAPGAARWAVLNFGMSGATSDEYEGIVEKALAAPDLKVVIFYSGYNDIFIKEADNKSFGGVWVA